MYRNAGSRESCGLGSTDATLLTTQSPGIWPMWAPSCSEGDVRHICGFDCVNCTIQALFHKISIFLMWSLPWWVQNLWPVVWQMPMYSKTAYDRSGLNRPDLTCPYREIWSIAWHAAWLHTCAGQIWPPDGFHSIWTACCRSGSNNRLNSRLHQELEQAYILAGAVPCILWDSPHGTQIHICFRTSEFAQWTFHWSLAGTIHAYLHSWWIDWLIG